MDIAAPRDGRRVAQLLGGLPDGLHHVPLGAAIAIARLQRPERAIGQDRTRPGPEILGRERRARRIADVGVDVLRSDVADLTRVVDVLEELLARQLLAAPDDRREPAVT